MTRRPLSGSRLVAAIGAQLHQLAEFGVDYLAPIRTVADMLRGCAHRIDLLALERGPWIEFNMDDGGAA